MEGKDVDAIRDTGASALIVDEALVPPDAPREGEVRLTGFRKAYSGMFPVVLVSIQTPFFSGKTWAISVPGPIHPVLVGNTLHTESGACEVDQLWPQGTVTAAPAVTRSQARTQDRDSNAHLFPDPTLVGLGKQDFIQLQESDQSIQHLRRAALANNPTSCYYLKNGVLF